MERSQKARCSGRGSHQGTSRTPPKIIPQPRTMTLRDPSSRRPSKQHCSDAFEWSPNSKGNRRNCNTNKKLFVHLERIPDATPNEPPQLQHYLQDAESNKECVSPPKLSPEVEFCKAGPSSPRATSHKSEADSLMSWSDELEGLFEEPERVSTGKEQLESIDGVDILTFETKEDMFEFTAIEMDHIHAPPIAYEDLTSAIVPTKTHDITKIKGWRTKYFAGNNYSSDYESCVVDLDIADKVSRESSPVPNVPEPKEKLEVKAATQRKIRTRKRKAIKTRFLADPPSSLDETWVKFAVSAVVVPGLTDTTAAKRLCKRDAISHSKAEVPDKEKSSISVLGRPALYPPSPYMRKKMKLVEKVKKKKKQAVQESDFKTTQSVKGIVKNLVTTVEDNGKIVPCSNAGKIKTNRELKKLGCVVIDVDSKTSKLTCQVNTPDSCSNEFCQLGCICNSLQTLPQSQKHCGKPECMFECTCTEAMPTLAVEKLIEDEKRDLAPAEKDFCNAVISGEGGIVMVKQRGRREIKVPGRFRDNNVLTGNELAAVIDSRRGPKIKAKLVKEAESVATYQPRVKKSILQNIQPDMQHEEMSRHVRFVPSPEFLETKSKGQQEKIETAPLFTQQGYISLDKEEQFLASHVKTEKQYENDDCIEIDDMGWRRLDADDEPPSEFGKIVSVTSLDPEEFEKTSSEGTNKTVIARVSSEQRHSAKMRAKRLVEFFILNSTVSTLVKSAYDLSTSVLEREAIMLVQWSSLKARFIEGSIFLWVKDLTHDLHFLVSDTEKIPLPDYTNLRSFSLNDMSIPQVAREMLQPYSKTQDNQRCCILWCNGIHWEFIGTLLKNTNGQKIMQTMSATCKPRTVLKSTKTLPHDVVPTKWYAITVNNDFEAVELKSENMLIPYSKISQIIASAWRYKKTVFIEIIKATCFSHPMTLTFGLYAIPNEFCTVYIGPYNTEEHALLELVPFQGQVCKSSISSMECTADTSLRLHQVPANPIYHMPLVTSKGRIRKVPKHLIEDMEEKVEEEIKPYSQPEVTTYEVESIEIPVPMPDDVQSELESDVESEFECHNLDGENSRTSPESDSEQSDTKKSPSKKKERSTFARLICSDVKISPVPIVISHNKCVKFRNPFGRRAVQFDNMDLTKRFLNYLCKEKEELTNLSWSVCTDVQSNDFYTNLMKSRVRSVNQRELDRTIGPECRLLSRPVRQKWKPHQRKMTRKNALILLLEECEMNSKKKKTQVPRGLECTLKDNSTSNTQHAYSRGHRDYVHELPSLKIENASHLQSELLDCSSNSTLIDDDDWLEENVDSPIQEHRLAHKDMEKVRRRELAMCFRTLATMLVPPDMLDRCSKIVILLKALSEVSKVKEVDQEKAKEKHKLEIKRDQLYKKFSQVIEDMDPREKARSVHQLKELLDALKNSVPRQIWQNTPPVSVLPDLPDVVPWPMPRPRSKRPARTAIKRARKSPGFIAYRTSSLPHHAPLPPGVRMTSETRVNPTPGTSPVKSQTEVNDSDDAEPGVQKEKVGSIIADHGAQNEKIGPIIAKPSMREHPSVRIAQPTLPNTGVKMSGFGSHVRPGLRITRPNSNVRMLQMDRHPIHLQGRTVATGVRISQPDIRGIAATYNQSFFKTEGNKVLPMVRMTLPPSDKVMPEPDIHIIEERRAAPPLVRMSKPPEDIYITGIVRAPPPLVRMSEPDISIIDVKSVSVKTPQPQPLSQKFEIKNRRPPFKRMQQPIVKFGRDTYVKNGRPPQVRMSGAMLNTKPDLSIKEMEQQTPSSADTLEISSQVSSHSTESIDMKIAPPNVCVNVQLQEDVLPSEIRQSRGMSDKSEIVPLSVPPETRMPTSSLHQYRAVGSEKINSTKFTVTQAHHKSKTAEDATKPHPMIKMRNLASLTNTNLPSHVRITSDAKINFAANNPALLSHAMVLTQPRFGSRCFSINKVNNPDLLGFEKEQQDSSITEMNEITITKEKADILEAEQPPAKMVKVNNTQRNTEEITISNEKGIVAEISSKKIQDSEDHFEVTITKVQTKEVPTTSSVENTRGKWKPLTRILPRPSPQQETEVKLNVKKECDVKKYKPLALKFSVNTSTPSPEYSKTGPEVVSNLSNVPLQHDTDKKLAGVPVNASNEIATGNIKKFTKIKTSPGIVRKLTDVPKFVINRELMRARLNAVKPKKLCAKQAETMAPVINEQPSPSLQQPAEASSSQLGVSDKTSPSAVPTQAAQDKTSTSAVPSQTAQDKTSTLAVPSQTAQDKTSTSAVPSQTAQDKTSTSAVSTQAAQDKTSTSAISSQAAQDKTSTSAVPAVPSQTTQDKTSTSAVPSQTAQDKTSTSAVSTQAAQDKTSTSAVPSQTRQDKTSTSAVSTQAAQDKTRTSAVPSQTTQDKISPSAVPTQAAQDKTRTSAVPSQTTQDKISPSAVPTQAAQDKTSTSAVPSQTRQDKTRTSAVPSQTTQDKTSTSAVPSQTRQDKTSPSAVPTQAAQDKTSTSAVPSQTRQDKTRTSAVPSQTTQDKTSTSADPSQTTQDKTSTSAVPSQTRQDKTRTSAVPSQTTHDKTSTSAVPTQAAQDKTSTSAVPSQTTQDKTSPSTVSTQAAQDKTSTSAVPSQTTQDKTSTSAVPTLATQDKTSTSAIPYQTARVAE